MGALKQSKLLDNLSNKMFTLIEDSGHSYHIKSETSHTEVVDGSNESSYYPDEKMDPSLRKMTFAKKV